MTVSISVFFAIFLLFCLKKIDLFSMISFYPVKLQLGKETDVTVSKVTNKTKHLHFCLGTALDLLIRFLRKQIHLLWF